MSVITLALAAAAATQTSAMLPICGRPLPQPADMAGSAKLRRLDKLPPANAYLTVMRTENGCIRPVLVSEERARRR